VEPREDVIDKRLLAVPRAPRPFVWRGRRRVVAAAFSPPPAVARPLPSPPPLPHARGPPRKWRDATRSAWERFHAGALLEPSPLFEANAPEQEVFSAHRWNQCRIPHIEGSACKPADSGLGDGRLGARGGKFRFIQHNATTAPVAWDLMHTPKFWLNHEQFSVVVLALPVLASLYAKSLGARRPGRAGNRLVAVGVYSRHPAAPPWSATPTSPSPCRP
jgi:hypothetical protein